MIPLKIALFCDFFNDLGGTEYYNVILATELKKRGCDVRVFIGEKSQQNAYLDILKEHSIEYTAPTKYHTDYSDRSIEKEFMLSILDYFQKWKPDIIHASPAGKLIVAFLENEKHPNIPIVATEYTTPSPKTAHWYPPDLNDYVNNIDAFIATCAASANGIRNFHKYENDIHLIGHLIKKPIVTKTKNIKNSVGCVARLSPEKGIDFLLGAWQFVIKKIPDATLHIYGHGPDEEHLRGASLALNIAKNVHFCGTFSPKTGIGSIAGRHKVFIQPSLFESIPTSLIELMGSSRAIIATDVGGIKEVINKNTGILLKSISLEKMANAIVSLLQNPKTQYRYAKNAQQLFNTQYSLKVNITKVLNLYKNIIAKYNAKHQKLEQLLHKFNCMSQNEILLLINASNGKLPEKFDFDTYYTFYKFFELVILPEVLKISPITLSGYHGIEHTKMVGRFALDLSVALNQNPIPGLFAAALHDCARKHNYYDEEHGPNAVPVANKLFKKDISLFLNKKEQSQIITAIKNHTIGMNATDIISAILWDSDRIRLSWDRTYKPEFFSTAPGRKIASMSETERNSILNKHKKLCDRLKKDISHKISA